MQQRNAVPQTHPVSCQGKRQRPWQEPEDLHAFMRVSIAQAPLLCFSLLSPLCFYVIEYSCLENPMDGGVWQATVHRVAKSRTRLSDFTSCLSCVQVMLNPGWPLGVLFFVFIVYIFQVPFPPHPPLWVVEPKILVPCYFNFFLSFMQVGQQKIVKAFQHCYCSVAKSCLTLCHPMDCSMPGFPALHHLLKFAHIQAH